MGRFFVRGAARVGVVVVALLASSLLAVPAASAAGSSLGQTGSQQGLNCSTFYNGGQFHVLQVSSGGGTNSYAVPQNGWLTEWFVNDTFDEAQTVALEVWRNVGSGNWALEFVSDPQTMSAGASVPSSGTQRGPFTLPTPVAVQAGDVLGLVVTSTAGGCIRYGNSGDDVFAAFGPLSLGATTNFDLNSYYPNNTLAVNVSATFVSSKLRVQKIVTGRDAVEGFVEHVTCSNKEAIVNVDLPFLSDGTPDAANPPNSDWTVVDGKWQFDFGFVADITCRVTETDTGDATTVQYGCAWTPVNVLSTAQNEFGCPGPSAGPSSDPTQSGTVVLEGNGDSGLLTVYNNFSEPPVTPTTPVTPVTPTAPVTPAPSPAAAVVARPSFTG